MTAFVKKQSFKSNAAKRRFMGRMKCKHMAELESLIEISAQLGVELGKAEASLKDARRDNTIDRNNRESIVSALSSIERAMFEHICNAFGLRREFMGVFRKAPKQVRIAAEMMCVLPTEDSIGRLSQWGSRCHEVAMHWLETRDPDKGKPLTMAEVLDGSITERSL